ILQHVVRRGPRQDVRCPLSAARRSLCVAGASPGDMIMKTDTLLCLVPRMVGALVLVLTLAPAPADAQQIIPRNDRVSWNIYRELITSPLYGVFDHLSFEAGDKGVVTLRGYVRRPITKDDAEARVKDVEGVEEVRNQ